MKRCRCYATGEPTKVEHDVMQDPETKDIPVAIASNYSENQMMQDAINQGAVDYIMKYQIEPSDLIAKIKTLMQGEVNTPQHID